MRGLFELEIDPNKVRRHNRHWWASAMGAPAIRGLLSDFRAPSSVFVRTGDFPLAAEALRDRRTSRRAFGGRVAGNSLRACEYAWTMRQVAEHGAGSGAAVEFSAGKSPTLIL